VRILNLEYEIVPAERLRPHPDNPRRGDLRAIGQSIERNRWYGAVLAQKSTGRILVGEHRFRAGLEAGQAAFPTIWLDADDAAALRVLLADNRANDVAGYDEAALAEILAREKDLAACGYSPEDATALRLAVEAAAAPAEEPPPAAPLTLRCPKCGLEFPKPGKRAGP